jgi:cytochrome c551/c552
MIAALFTVAPDAGAQDAAAAELAKRGRSLWQNRGCSGCHAIGKPMAGPDLAGVTARRTREWLDRFLKDTDNMLKSDPVAQALLKEFKGIRMPQQKLSDADINALLAYIESEEARRK